MNNLALSLLLLAVTALWGWTFVIVKDAVADYAVVSFLAIRFSIAAICLAPVLWCRPRWETVKIGAAIGLVLAAAYLFQTFGLVYTTATNSGLITGLFVVFAPLANHLLFGVRMHPALWIAVAMSLFGLAMLTGLSVDRLTIGDALTLGAATCLGVHIAVLDRFAKHHDAKVLALAQIVAAMAVFWFSSATLEPLYWPTTRVWFALLVTGILATAVGFYVQTYVQQRLPAIRTAVLLTMEPVFAMFFGYLAGDRLTPMQISVVLLMGSALLLTEWKQASGIRNGTNDAAAG